MLVSALALAGCTAEGAARPEPTTTSATPVPTPTVSPSPTPSSSPSAAPTSGPDQDVTKPPARPAALDGPATEDNAIAVGKYFMSLFPFIIATGDYAEWDALSGPDCQFCASSRERAAKIHEAGNHGTGGAMDIGLGTVATDRDGSFLVGIQLVEHGSQTVDSDGNVIEDFPGDMTLRASMKLSHGADGWTVDGVQVEQFGSGR
ncbi:DUF6318 family protein [Cellulomonas sp. PSBB021]|uniref:DUF6318 family protein n=1 Tax=Cellulomonas sp. PSBB021 TaxID=2003551 RepID=UPI0018E0092A|nr:DUF6318 family protein [Cellulomonas sp. PSBB021]